MHCKHANNTLMETSDEKPCTNILMLKFQNDIPELNGRKKQKYYENGDNKGNLYVFF